MVGTKVGRLLFISILCLIIHSFLVRAQPPPQSYVNHDPGTRLKALLRRAALSSEVTITDSAITNIFAEFRKLPQHARQALMNDPPEVIGETLSAYFGLKKKKLGSIILTEDDISDLDLRFLRYEACLQTSFREARLELDQGADSVLQKSYWALPDSVKSQLDTAPYATVKGGLSRYITAKRRLGNQGLSSNGFAKDFDWGYFHDESLNFATVRFESFRAGQIYSVSTGKLDKRTKINFKGGEFITMTIPVYGDSLSFSGQIGGIRHTWSAIGVDAEQGVAFYTAGGLSQGAKITIESKPDKAEVFFDKKYVRVKTKTSIIKDPGTYELCLKLPGYVDYCVEISVEAGEEKTIKAVFTPESRSTLAITTIPPGANISLDGEWSTAKTNAVLVLDSAEHIVLITLDGYKDLQRKVMLEAGKRTNLLVNLEVEYSSEGEES